MNSRLLLKIVACQFLVLIAILIILSETVYSKELCLSNDHGLRLIVDDNLVETSISEENKLSGSICEIEDISDSVFKGTILVRKIFRKNMDEITLDKYSDEVLRMYKRGFSPDITMVEKKQIIKPINGYQMALYSNQMKSLIVHYATVNSGFEYNIAFTFPEDGRTKYIPVVQRILEGIKFIDDLSLFNRLLSMKLSLFKLDSVKIPYPENWRVFSSENISELKEWEFNDHLYSSLILNKEATYVFKSKYENEQLFTMTLTVIPKEIDIERLYPSVQQQINSLFVKDYGPKYLDKSKGKIVIKERTYYNFTFETTKAGDYSTLNKYWFSNKSFTYLIGFKTPTVWFSALKPKMDELIERIEY